ncbi:MAG: RNA-binding protein [Thermoplasmata archaeon]|nr:MAG: RNA-binding protein [Thermoplasmata archaeon]RLF37098.1 MAG: RNA-binding protein [Thermoplasmata archaeon]
MKNLDNIIEKIEKHINEKDRIREQALRSSRDIIIRCRKAIQHLHQNQNKEAGQHIKKASEELAELYNLTKKHADLYYSGFVENAAQEVVEAYCLLNILQDKDLPDPDEIKTTYSSYLLGLCDVVGELRRSALDCILAGEASEANKYLNLMEKIYDVIIRFDYPSALVPIRRKQDMIRSLIEKTRGELAVASCERRIDYKTDEFRGILDIINKEKTKKKKGKKKNMDINIDKIW